MTAMRRQEGPRAPLFYAASFLWCCSVASAQSVDLARLEACNALPTDEARLACFEAIVSPQDPEPEPAAAPASAPASNPEPASAPSAQQEADTINEPIAAPAAAPVVEAAAPAETASEVAASATTAADVADAPVVEPTPAPAAEPTAASRDEDFGREHIESASEDEPYQLQAVAVEAVRRRDRGVTFTLDNGQVWQQIDDRYFPYPKDEDFAIVISQGMMGDYRLRVGGTGRMIRVRRTK